MSVVAIGDNVVDCYLHTGCMYPGGNCVNVAVAVARAGMPAAYVGALGTDQAGDLLHSALTAERVDLTHVRRVQGRNSHATVTLVDGDRAFGPGGRGVRDFEPTTADLAFVGGFVVAHSSYCSGLEEHMGSLASATSVSFDFDDRVHSDYAESLLPHTWFATFSVAGLSDQELTDVAKWAYDRGPAYVLLTRGAWGAALYDGATLHLQAAHPTDVVDTLGAGDAFIGRTLVGLISDEPVRGLLDAAAAAASATCGLSGGFGYGAELPPGYP